MSTIITTKENKIPVINIEWCKGCGICVEFCPKDALVMNDMEKSTLAYPEKCNGCGMCELRCPGLAIELKFGKGLEYSSELPRPQCGSS